MPKGGTMHIRLVGGSAAHLTVTDTGSGMDDATLTRIFEPFFTTKLRGRGTGGLSTCFGIIQDAGGTVDVTSQLGRGTRFVIQLPCTDEALPLAPAGPDQVAQARGERVLLVEDDEPLRRVTARSLRAAGYRVAIASDGLTAIARLNELGPTLDLVYSDIVMAGGSGYDVAAHAARVAPQARVLLTTGYIDESVDRQGQADLPILWKPVAPERMLAAIRQALAEPRPGRRRRAVLIDDHLPTTRALVRMLNKHDFDVSVAHTVAEGRGLLECSDTPDVVLCDLGLPDGSGEELLIEVATKRPTLAGRCILLTGGATDPKAAAALQATRHPVLQKPIRPADLLRALNNHGGGTP